MKLLKELPIYVGLAVLVAVVFLLTSCATYEDAQGNKITKADALFNEAKICSKELGVYEVDKKRLVCESAIGSTVQGCETAFPYPDTYEACWVKYSEHLDAIEKREVERSLKCPRGTVGWCTKRLSDVRCSCVPSYDVRRALEEMVEY